MMTQRGRGLGCPATKAVQTQPCSAHKPRPSRLLPSLPPPIFSRAGICLPVDCSIMQEEYLFQNCFVSTTAQGAALRWKRCKFSKTHILQNINCKGKAFAGIAHPSCSLLISCPSTSSAISVSSSLVQLHRDLGSENTQKWNNGTNAWDRDGKMQGYYSLLPGLELGKPSCLFGNCSLGKGFGITPRKQKLKSDTELDGPHI